MMMMPNSFFVLFGASLLLVSSSRAQRIRSICSPTKYEFIFDFALECPGNIKLDLEEIILSTMCQVTVESTQTNPDEIPVSVSSIQLLGLGADIGNAIISSTIKFGPFVDGDTFTYTSVSEVDLSNGLTDIFPSGIQMNLMGLNAAGERIFNNWFIRFSNDCSICDEDGVKVGDEIGWVRVTGLTDPRVENCPATSEAPVTTSEPTIAPITPTQEPTGAPISPSPTVLPTSPPSLPLPTTSPIVPTVAPVDDSLAPTLTSTMAPSETMESAMCFPGDSMVQMKGKGNVLMSSLQIGDRILVDSEGKYETVYSFGHRKQDAIHEYLQITTSLRASIQLSEDHMIFLKDGRAVPALAVQIGDMLQQVVVKGDDTQDSVVTSIIKISKKGAFAPFTNSGKIIVNELLVSNYISYQKSECLTIAGQSTGLSYQFMAHTFQGFHRVWCTYFSSCLHETYTESGLSNWVAIPHAVFKSFVKQQPQMIMFILGVPLLALLVAMSCLVSMVALP